MRFLHVSNLKSSNSTIVYHLEVVFWRRAWRRRDNRPFSAQVALHESFALRETVGAGPERSKQGQLGGVHHHRGAIHRLLLLSFVVFFGWIRGFVLFFFPPLLSAVRFRSFRDWQLVRRIQQALRKWKLQIEIKEWMTLKEKKNVVTIEEKTWWKNNAMFQ